MDVQPWRDTLDALTQPEGWIGSPDNERAKLARKVLDGYERPNGWIAYDLPSRTVREAAKDQTIPELATEAAKQRDAILALAVLHELGRWIARQQHHSETGVAELAGAVVHSALTADVGLRAQRAQHPGSKSYSPVDFAHGESAKHFFEDILREKLIRREVAGVSVRDKVPTNYDPGDEASILLWERLWTAGAILMLLEWVAEHCATAHEIGRVIWHSSSRWVPSDAIIPTTTNFAKKPKYDGNNVHAGLRTRAAIAFIFAGSESLRGMARDAPWSVVFRLRALHSRTVGSQAFYDGYKALHLYQAVLSDCLYVANGSAAMKEHEPRPSLVADHEAGELSTLAPEQRAALAHTSTARRNLRATQEARIGTGRKGLTGPVRFYPASKSLQVSALNGTASALGSAFPLEPLSHRSLRLLPAEGEPGARWQPIGSIELFRELGPDVDWIDLLVVARIDDRQILLPVTAERDASKEDGPVRSLLVLDEGASHAIRADSLRRALRVPDALVGVVVRKGQGAFVVLEIDINARRTHAAGT